MVGDSISITESGGFHNSTRNKKNNVIRRGSPWPDVGHPSNMAEKENEKTKLKVVLISFVANSRGGMYPIVLGSCVTIASRWTTIIIRRTTIATITPNGQRLQLLHPMAALDGVTIVSLNNSGTFLWVPRGFADQRPRDSTDRLSNFVIELYSSSPALFRAPLVPIRHHLFLQLSDTVGSEATFGGERPSSVSWS